MVGTGQAAELGILIGNGDALEQAQRLTAVVLDKTGTITRGRPAVTSVIATAGRVEEEVLALAAAAEAGSEHPLAEAVMTAATDRGLTPPQLRRFEAIPGQGVEATVGGRQVRVGNRALMTAGGIDISSLAVAGTAAAAAGQTPVYVAVGREAIGLVTIADPVKPGAAETVAQLKALGLEVWMLTGDTTATAEAVAATVGIEQVIAEVLPAQKAERISALQAGGRVVAMVGDGINDAPALAQADLGVAIGTGTDVAIAASDITLVGGDLRGIVSAIALSRRTVSTIKQGLGWAFGYNILLIPVAAGALYLVNGILLDPALAAAAMAMSSVSVVTNAQRLRRFRRPADVREILHPPLAARAGQYAYLSTVAILALAIGAGLTGLSRTDTAARGMNGVLAWTQSTGMPMRPVMSTMMTTDVDPVDAAEAQVHVRLGLPAVLRPGQPARMTVTLTDARTGAPVTDLTLSHQVWMHLIATRADLGTFAHVHPEPASRPGQLAVDLIFPTPGRYVINTEFRREGQMADIHDRQAITVPGTAPPAGRLVPSPRTQTIDGMRIELHGDATVGRTSDLTLTVADAATGRPVDNLQPYLAAAGHVIIIGAGADTFAHQHADVEDSQGRPVFALPGQRFGPELPFRCHFDRPGLYRLWAQFENAGGQVVTAPFTVSAR